MAEQDVRVQPFKQWLEHRLKRAERDAIDDFAHKLIADRSVPRSGSRALYVAHLRGKGYSQHALEVFARAWAEMVQASE